MSKVWYAGQVGSRTITKQDWGTYGISADTVTWSGKNGWALDTEQFTTEQLTFLAAQKEFIFDQVGPRRPISPNSVPAHHKSNYAYYLATRALVAADPEYIGGILRDFLEENPDALRLAFQARSPKIIDVRDYGATGDGVTDDTEAIDDAVAHLTDHSVLYFSGGVYRYATPKRYAAAITLAGLNNVIVHFDGAELLMDNLEEMEWGGDPENLKMIATTSGIRVLGKCENITLLNARIRWKTRADTRGGHSNGICAFGYPSDSPPPEGWEGSTGKITNLTLINPYVEGSGEAGILIYGVSDPKVYGSRVVDTLADGLHFNACRRINVNNHHAENVEDDGIAFVCYYHEELLWEDDTIGPFWQQELSDWTNSGVATGIVATGNRSNGCRIHMAKDLWVNGLNVTNKEFVLNLTTAELTLSPPNPWRGIASENILVTGVVGEDCQNGIFIQLYAINTDDDEKFWRHKNVLIQGAVLKNMGNWSITAENTFRDDTKSACAGVTMRDIKCIAGDNTKGLPYGGHGGIRLCGFRDSGFHNIELISPADHDPGTAEFVVMSSSQFITEHWWTDPETDELIIVGEGITPDQLHASNIILDNIITRDSGMIIVQDISGVSIGRMDSYNAAGVGIALYNVANLNAKHLGAVNPGRSLPLGRGVQVNRFYNVNIQDIIIDHDDHEPEDLWQCFEAGGGDEDVNISGQGLHVENLVYTSLFDKYQSEVAIQAGIYAIKDCYVNAKWLHRGEENPKWRYRRYGPQITDKDPSTWLNLGNEIQDFNELMRGGIYTIAGEDMSEPGTEDNHAPGNTGMVILTVTVMNPNEDDIPLDVIQQFFAIDSGKQGYRRFHGDGANTWTDWIIAGAKQPIKGVNENYTLTREDNGYLLLMGPGGPITLDVGDVLEPGMQCDMIVVSGQDVTLVPGEDTYIGNSGGLVVPYNRKVNLYCYNDNQYIFSR